LGNREGFDTSLATARLAVCAERTRRRALPPGSRAEILRMDRDAVGLAIAVQVTDEAGRPIVGLSPADFAVAMDGKSASVARAEIVDKPARRRWRLAVVVERTAAARVELAAGAVLAIAAADTDETTLVLCGDTNEKVRTPEPLAVLEALLRSGPSRDCALPEAIALASADLHGRAREALMIFAAERSVPDSTIALLAELGAPVFVAGTGRNPGNLQRLPACGGEYFALTSPVGREQLRSRFRAARPDAGASYRLSVAQAPAPGVRVAVTAGGDNAATAAARL